MAPNKKLLKIIELLDRSIQLTREFMNDWLLFNQILSAYPSPGVNKAQLENQFLKIKSKLAREHQVLKESLGADYKFDANTMNIVSGATNLESIYSQSEVAIKKLQNEWHRAFISINETLGALEDKKVRAESGEHVMVGNMMAAPPKQSMSKGTKNGLIFLAIVIVIAAILYFTGLGEMYFNAATGNRGSLPQ
ncbi:MAG: hypothetical protein HUU46_22400 [Candidatus Hydrogenedentes bacterium]|nr:hypothetical protein [Candidatus Hydrogenedentota bacterium]